VLPENNCLSRATGTLVYRHRHMRSLLPLVRALRGSGRDAVASSATTDVVEEREHHKRHPICRETKAKLRM
jgi:hypothetical protein